MKSPSKSKTATKNPAKKSAAKKSAPKKSAPKKAEIKKTAAKKSVPESEPSSQSKANRHAEAYMEARAFEHKLVEDGPHPWIRPDLFWALMVKDEQAEATAVLASLAAFAEPALEHSQLPEELLAWVVTLKGYHVVFYMSLPAPPSWIEGEHFLEPFPDIATYYHIEHSASDMGSDALVFYDGEKQEQPMCLSSEGNDFGSEARMGKDGKKPVDNGVWGLLKKRTGISLDELQASIRKGKPVWLVHKCIPVWTIAEEDL